MAFHLTKLQKSLTSIHPGLLPLPQRPNCRSQSVKSSPFVFYVCIVHSQTCWRLCQSTSVLGNSCSGYDLRDHCEALSFPRHVGSCRTVLRQTLPAILE
ncbi:hypothetical protein AVEN_32095-1 [Araneus ventricosus]|uniref:Uncharacterized protein n=1 Tax=Araneus ventricosus TaxID=182803 RepID=A0A4Y2VBC1_ARAVE|nr:hypothetical protein AVEN_32095-1 [Araneus ventricosus]